jgi:hypothetical protein
MEKRVSCLALQFSSFSYDFFFLKNYSLLKGVSSYSRKRCSRVIFGIHCIQGTTLPNSLTLRKETTVLVLIYFCLNIFPIISIIFPTGFGDDFYNNYLFPCRYTQLKYIETLAQRILTIYMPTPGPRLYGIYSSDLSIKMQLRAT